MCKLPQDTKRKISKQFEYIHVSLNDHYSKLDDSGKKIEKCRLIKLLLGLANDLLSIQVAQSAGAEKGMSFRALPQLFENKAVAAHNVYGIKEMPAELINTLSILEKGLQGNVLPKITTIKKCEELLKDYYNKEFSEISTQEKALRVNGDIIYFQNGIIVLDAGKDSNGNWSIVQTTILQGRTLAIANQTAEFSEVRVVSEINPKEVSGEIVPKSLASNKSIVSLAFRNVKQQIIALMGAYKDDLSI